MLEFKIIQELKPNTEILEIIKSYTYITKKGNINKYGRMRLAYLKDYKKAIYTSLIMKDELTNHLISVSKNSADLLNALMESYKKTDERLSEKRKKLIILNGQNL